MPPSGGWIQPGWTRDLAQECLGLRERATPGDWRLFPMMSQLGSALAGLGQFEEAERRMIDGYQGLRAREATIPVSRRSEIRSAAERVARLYQDWGKPEEAAAWMRSAGSSNTSP